ncbi:MAG: hypothetical protein KY443_07170 [Actinobacteria bacterium]|nr:hypothetical protein [Actinomycetota bacterium]
MRRSRLFALVPLVALVALALAACGDSSDTTTTGSQDTSSTSAAASGTVRVADSSLGDILVDERGMTLYLFTNDSEGTSVCEGSCAELWPPLRADGGPTGGAGVDGAKLSTITRPDGSTQVAYAGHPLYFYAKDSAPGDVTGQNVGGVWFAVRPDGTPVSGQSESTDY